MTGTSIVVPVYNAAGTLPALVGRLTPVLASLGQPFEIILVNDGSRDDTWDVMTGLCREHPEIVAIDLARNAGQHNALLAGIRQARYGVTITMDDDLQNPPEEVPRLRAALTDDLDVVYGVAHEVAQDRWRAAASGLIRWVLSMVMGATTARHVSAFRAIRTETREAFSGYRGSFVSIDVLLTWGTLRFGSVPVEHHPRAAGRSNYSVWKLFTHAMNLLTGFTIVPLQIASVVGFGLTLFGCLVLAFVVIRFIMSGGVVPGFTFLASLITIFAGGQLFALGIMGEYLARMHFRTMDRPSYTVRRIVAAADARAASADRP